jgi:outer membrane protein TolC
MLLFVRKEWKSESVKTECLQWIVSALFCLSFLAGTAGAQSSDAPHQKAATPATTPIVITLQEAIKRAQAAEPTFANSVANARVAGLDKSIARSALLPNARFSGQGIYVQPNGLREVGGEGVVNTNPKFVSADARPREYIAQGVVEESVGLGSIAAVRRANAADAVAKAELEIARRGLVAAVTGLYYGVASADHKLAIAQQAATEAADFTKLTEQREQAREAAHADTIKAQLQQQQRERELADATLNADKSRLELGVLLFSDPHTPYTISISESPAALASREEFNQLASNNSAELKSALATLNASGAEVLTAQAAYLPTIGLNYTYGIDANEFASRGPLTPDGVRTHNLGYSAAVTVNLPVWDWFATEHKVKQSEIKRDAAKVALTATQRRLIAQLDQVYAEAQTARAQLTSLDASVATAAESLRLTKLRYTGGEATVLEVVDAQGAYITAQNAREDGRVRYETALAQLQTLTGTM